MDKKQQQERQKFMFRLVEEYLSSGQSLLRFSKEHGIPNTTFQNWHKKYLRQNKAQTKEKLAQRFMPIQISQTFGCPLSAELCYPNGILLKLTNITDIGLINELIHSYPSC